MKKLFSKIYQAFNLLIVLELAFAPMAMANGQSDFWKSAAAITGTVTNAIQAGVNGYTQGIDQEGAQYEQFKAQLGQQTAVRPVDPRQIPPVFSSCLVLPARTNMVDDNLMCSQTDPGQLRVGYAAALKDIAEFNINEYENFSKRGNERFTTQGLGCYERGIQDFETRLKNREVELEKYKARLEALLDKFKLDTKPFLEGIKRTSAILDGKDPGKYLKDFKFENLLLGGNDPNNQCSSFISGTQLAKAAKGSGTKGGLRAIEELLSEQLDQRDGNKSSLSALTASEILSQGKMAQVEKDINAFSDSIARQMSDRNPTQGTAGIAVSKKSNFINMNNPAIKSALDRYDTKIKNKVTALEKKYNITKSVAGFKGKVLNDTPASILADISNGGDIDLEEISTRLTNFQNDFKKSCVEDIIKNSFGSVGKFARQFKNPNVSSTGNKTDNFLASSLVKDMTSEDDIEVVLRNLESNQAKSIYNRYVMKTGRSFEVDGKKFNASTPLRPAQMLGVFVQSCKKNYRITNRVNGNSTTSPAKAVERIMKYASDIKNMQKTAGSEVASIIRKDMISCSDDKSTGVSSMSCSTGTLSLDNPNFCARTAKLCAGNMNACFKRAESTVARISGEQQKFKKQYNAVAENFRTGLKQEITAIQGFLENQGRLLDAQLNIGSVFGVPQTDQQLKISENLFQGTGQSSEKDIDPDLEILDPEQYLNKALADIDTTLKTLQEQRADYVGNDAKGNVKGLSSSGKLGKMAQQYVDSYKEAAKEWQQVFNDCKGMITQLEQALAKENEKIAKQNEELGKACQELIAFQNDPDEDKAQELASDLGKVVQMAAAIPGYNQQTNAVDQANINAILQFNSSCGEASEGANYAWASQGNKVSLDDFCNGGKGEKMFPGYANRACSRARGKAGESCTEESLGQKLANSGKILCETSSGKLKLVSDKGECAKKSADSNELLNQVTDANLSSQSKQIKRSIASLFNCSDGLVDSSKKDEAQKELTAMIRAYNCNEDRKRAGQLGIAACNAQLANSGVGMKDSIGGTLTQAAQALGQLGALRER